MAKCPHCANTTATYTDPQLQVRCTVCFNHMDGTAGTPIGRMIDTTAPITIVLADGTTKAYT
jgi:hypothetical protein